MDRIYSSTVRDDIRKTVDSAIASKSIVHLSVLAEEVRKRNEAENIALEDVERLVPLSSTVRKGSESLVQLRSSHFQGFQFFQFWADAWDDELDCARPRIVRQFPRTKRP